MDDLDAVFLAQKGDPRGEPVNDAVLPLDHLWQINGQTLNRDAHPLGVLRLESEIRGVDQRLRGNAADVEAHPTERWGLLHQDHVLAELREPNSGHIATGSGTDHHNLTPTGNRSNNHHNLAISTIGSDTRRTKSLMNLAASAPSM